MMTSGCFICPCTAPLWAPQGGQKKEEKRLRPLHTGTIDGSPNWVLGGFRGTRRSRKDGGAVRP
jgi:hypothetical protein